MTAHSSSLGRIASQFTATEIEALLITAAEAVFGNAIREGTLSQRQLELSERVYRLLERVPASPVRQDASWPVHVRGIDAETLNDGIDAIVRLIHQHGIMADAVAEEIYALASRLLHAAEILDPDTDQPLSRERTNQLCDDLEMQCQDVNAVAAPRTWVVTQLGTVCAGIVGAFTDSLRATAEDIAQTDRTPTRRY